MKEGELFNKSIWYVGFDSKNGRLLVVSKRCGHDSRLGDGLHESRGFSSVRGEIQVDDKVESPTLDDLLKFILDFDEGADTSIGWAATVGQDDVVFVPQGWIIAEQCTGATPLVYGIRKSYMLKTEASKAQYGKVIEILKSSDRDTAKMEEFLALYGEDKGSDDGKVGEDQGKGDGDK